MTTNSLQTKHVAGEERLGMFAEHRRLLARYEENMQPGGAQRRGLTALSLQGTRSAGSFQSRPPVSDRASFLHVHVASLPMTWGISVGAPAHVGVAHVPNGTVFVFYMYDVLLVSLAESGAAIFPSPKMGLALGWRRGTSPGGMLQVNPTFQWPSGDHVSQT